MIENLHRQSPKARSQPMKGSTKGTIRGFISTVNISQKLYVCTTVISRDHLSTPNIALHSIAENDLAIELEHKANCSF